MGERFERSPGTDAVARLLPGAREIVSARGTCGRSDRSVINVHVLV